MAQWYEINGQPVPAGTPGAVFHNTDNAPLGDQGDTRYGTWTQGGFEPPAPSSGQDAAPQVAGAQPAAAPQDRQQMRDTVWSELAARYWAAKEGIPLEQMRELIQTPEYAAKKEAALQVAEKGGLTSYLPPELGGGGGDFGPGGNVLPGGGTGGGNGDLSEYFKALQEGSRAKWELAKQQALQEMQLARNTDERQAAQLKLNQADQELTKLKFEETKRQFDVGTGETKRQFDEQMALRKQEAERTWQDAQQRLQLAKNADERAAAQLDLDKASRELDRLRFEESKRQFDVGTYSSLAQNLLGTAAGLTGPRDYMKFQEYTSGGRNLLDQLYGSTPRPDFSAPTQGLESMTLQSLMQSLGLGGAQAGGRPSQPGNGYVGGDFGSGGNVLPGAPPQPGQGVVGIPERDWAQQSTGEPRRGPNGTIVNSTQQVPAPHQVNPFVWSSLGPVGQQLTLGMAEKSGWDPNEFQRQIEASRPQGKAPQATRYGFGALA